VLIALFCAPVDLQGAKNQTYPAMPQYADISTAEQAALAKLAKMNQPDRFSLGKGEEIFSDDGTPLCYVFSLIPQGYVVVSADRNLPPVPAYSFTSDFYCDGDKDQVFLEMIKTDLGLRLNAVPSLPVKLIERRHEQWDRLFENPKPDSRFQQWPPEGSTPTGGWIETNWTQNAPYKNFCPMDLVNGARSVAGCPAVAMAQIMNFHETTNEVVFTDSDDYRHTYAGNNYWIDDDHVAYDFPSFPELNAYLATLESHYANHTSLTAEDKAAITFACGVAATQVYNVGGSGTFGVNQALDAYLKFNCDTVELLDESDPDLYDRLSLNMKQAHPAHLAIVNPSWTSGHNVVVDGYNTDDYYHLNFGWGGPYNGWYLLPDEIPYGLTVIEGVIVDILIYDAELETDTDEIACPGGGIVNFTLDAGTENAGRYYLLLGGISGTDPGTLLPWGHATLPLNWDIITDTILAYLNTTAFYDFLGILDGNGRATAQMNLPSLPVGLGGVVIHFAFTCNNPFDVVSNPAAVEIIE
ncbi:MAG: C10 family peptidase, partial [Planctomycetes bacterium]|nr:C10 family peptidase [Planctomycetota bacterium]